MNCFCDLKPKLGLRILSVQTRNYGILNLYVFEQKQTETRADTRKEYEKKAKMYKEAYRKYFT